MSFLLEDAAAAEDMAAGSEELYEGEATEASGEFGRTLDRNLRNAGENTPEEREAQSVAEQTAADAVAEQYTDKATNGSSTPKERKDAIDELNEAGKAFEDDVQKNGKVAAENKLLLETGDSALSGMSPKSREIMDAVRTKFKGMSDNLSGMLKSGKELTPEMKTAQEASEELDAASAKTIKLKKLRMGKDGKYGDFQTTAEWKNAIKEAEGEEAAARTKFDNAVNDIKGMDYVEMKCGRYGKDFFKELMARKKLLLGLGGFLLFLQLIANAVSGCYLYKGAQSTKLLPSGDNCNYTDGDDARKNCICMGALDKSLGKPKNVLCNANKPAADGTPYCCGTKKYPLCNALGDNPAADDYIQYSYAHFTPSKVLSAIPGVAYNAGQALIASAGFAVKYMKYIILAVIIVAVLMILAAGYRFLNPPVTTGRGGAPGDEFE